MRRLFMVLVCLLWWNHVSSQSGSADLQCLTLAIGGKTAFDVSPGTVCFHCVFGGMVATDAVFEINSDDIDPNVGTVVNGTLVVFDSERVFNTITTTLVSCSDTSTLLMIGARLSLKILRPPVIMGENTVSEGDTLSLSCDTRNSHPNPLTFWFNPDGDIVASSFGNLNVMNINRSMGGVYTCVALLLSDSTTTMNSSVNVIVQFLDPPLVVGETVVDEGGTLNLICNASNSNPLSSVHWLNPAGEMVGDGGFLDIVNIHKSRGGTYTCLASLNSSIAAINTTVTVTIQVHCAALTSTDAIIVTVTSTITGSNATYHCRDEPSNIHTTQCTGGVWEPNPNVTLDCTKPAVHCAPLASTDAIIVNVTSTVVGSNATYHCRHDPSSVYITQCTTNRMWDPDPNTTLNCLKPECDAVQDTPTWTYVVVVVLSVAVVGLALMIVALQLKRSITRKSQPARNDLEPPNYGQCTPNKPQEWIDTSSNACYDSVHKIGDHCHMDVNVSYVTTGHRSAERITGPS